MYSFQSEGLGSVVITSFGIDELLLAKQAMCVTIETHGDAKT